VDYQSASTGKSMPFEFTVDGRVEAAACPHGGGE
jgi:hypothetical protein